MAARPPVPPRPYIFEDRDSHSNIPPPPPIPPLPPNFRPEIDYDSPPHFVDPLLAPRPTRLTPDVPADMARNLDDQVAFARYPTPQPPPQQQVNYNPGFIMPNYRGPSPAPPLPSSGAGYPSPPLPTPFPNAPRTESLSASMANLSFNPMPVPTPRAPSAFSTTSSSDNYSLPSPHLALQQQPQSQQSAANNAGLPSLTAALPTVSALLAAQQAIQAPSSDTAGKVAWCRDVLSLVNRASQIAAGGGGSGQSGTDPIPGPARISDPSLQRLADVAVPLVLGIANGAQPPQGSSSKLAPPIAEAVYLRAVIAAAGSFPQHLQQNPRTAFRDFESAARSGYHAAWFRLGRDYENFGDDAHARDCFERGVKLGVESCIYRMGMSHLMGQLGLPPNQQIAIPLLHRAATLASVDVPQPAYVYGLLLLEEFKHVSIPLSLFSPLIPAGSSTQLEARKHLERAAYLNFAPAQYKLGHAYEFALPPFPYDALLSVQYYSLASQQGEVEADMALSKWFLCGAEGSFEKDEALAFTFAEKAARKGLASAEFAMGYYKEVGIGCALDVDASKKWYQKAANHGNADATERLAALNQASPQALSRQEHETITDNKLVRKRTQAKQRSEAAMGRQQQQPMPPMPGRGQKASEVVDVIRRNSRIDHPYHPRSSSYTAGQASNGPPSSYQQPFPQQQQQQHPGGYGGHANTLPPSAGYQSNGGGPQNSGPGRFPGGPGGPGGVQASNRPRYSLSDSPTPPLGHIPEGGPGGPGRRAQSPAQGGRGRGRGGRFQDSPPRQQQQLTSSPGSGPGQLPGNSGSASAPPSTTIPQQQSPPQQSTVKYQSFAEMGFQSQSATEKDCVIM